MVRGNCSDRKRRQPRPNSGINHFYHVDVRAFCIAVVLFLEHWIKVKKKIVTCSILHVMEELNTQDND